VSARLPKHLYYKRALTTVLLPNHKHRGTQASCDAHREWYPTSRFGEGLERERYLCLVLYLLTAPQLRFRALLTEKGAESRVVENIQSEGSL
jgi:hypothetical protein